MKFAQGNLWNQPANVYLATGNSTLRKDGALVMGRGAALEMKLKFPGCDLAFGKQIKIAKDNYGVVYTHGLLRDHPLNCVGVFQVKHFFRDQAEDAIIAHSVEVLRILALGVWKGMAISMNFPGIGAGRRKREEILPLLTRIPDNVTVWEFDNASKQE